MGFGGRGFWGFRGFRGLRGFRVWGFRVEFGGLVGVYRVLVLRDWGFRLGSFGVSSAILATYKVSRHVDLATGRLRGFRSSGVEARKTVRAKREVQ